MDELGLTMSELARKTGVSRQALYAMLDGSTAQARVSTLIALAHALKVHPIVLFRHSLSQMELPKFTTTGAKYQFDASGFVRETVPDNAEVIAGQTFCKTWEIQNIGHVAWSKRKLLCMDENVDAPRWGEGAPCNANRRLLPSENCISIPDTLPGDSVLLNVQFTAPDHPCSVMSYWKMIDEQGDICFPETEGIWCLVRVVSL